MFSNQQNHKYKCKTTFGNRMVRNALINAYPSDRLKLSKRKLFSNRTSRPTNQPSNQPTNGIYIILVLMSSCMTLIHSSNIAFTDDYIFHFMHIHCMYHTKLWFFIVQMDRMVCIVDNVIQV